MIINSDDYSYILQKSLIYLQYLSSNNNDIEKRLEISLYSVLHLLTYYIYNNLCGNNLVIISWMKLVNLILILMLNLIIIWTNQDDNNKNG